MVVDNEAVSKIIKSYVADVKKNMHIDKAYLYGSYAKDNQHQDSDIDICFFSSDFEGQRSVDVLTRLIGLTRGYKSVDIEPRVFPTSEIDMGNPFVDEVLKTGREIL